MNDFNWGSYQGWCNKKEWDAEGHDPVCSCDECHIIHIDMGQVEENATMADFECCILDHTASRPGKPYEQD